MAGRLAGKPIPITGTAGGRGRAAAILFAREGATVFGYVLPDKAGEQEETVRLATAGGGRLEAVIADMTDPDAARDWVEACAAEAGAIDALYNNAALERFAPADPDFRTTYKGWPLLRRTGKPNEIAFCALWLVSDESGFVTGANVPVDGGWTAKGGLTPKSGELERLQSIVFQAA